MRAKNDPDGRGSMVSGFRENGVGRRGNGCGARLAGVTGQGTGLRPGYVGVAGRGTRLRPVLCGRDGTGDGVTTGALRIVRVCEESHRQVSLRSLTAFFFDRFAMGEAMGALPPYPHQGFHPWTPPGTSPWTLLRFALMARYFEDYVRHVTVRCVCAVRSPPA